MGAKRFRRMSEAYLAECPSRSFTLAQSGFAAGRVAEGQSKVAGCRIAACTGHDCAGVGAHRSLRRRGAAADYAGGAGAGRRGNSTSAPAVHSVAQAALSCGRPRHRGQRKEAHEPGWLRQCGTIALPEGARRLPGTVTGWTTRCITVAWTAAFRLLSAVRARVTTLMGAIEAAFETATGQKTNKRRKSRAGSGCGSRWAGSRRRRPEQLVNKPSDNIAVNSLRVTDSVQPIRCNPCFLLAVRLYWGWQFAQAGWGKLHRMPDVIQFFASLGIPAPAANAWFVTLLEFVGGILLAVGLGSRLLALISVGDMLVAYITADREAFFGFFTHPDNLRRRSLCLSRRLADHPYLWAGQDLDRCTTGEKFRSKKPRAQPPGPVAAA